MQLVQQLQEQQFVAIQNELSLALARLTKAEDEIKALEDEMSTQYYSPLEWFMN